MGALEKQMGEGWGGGQQQNNNWSRLQKGHNCVGSGCPGDSDDSLIMCSTGLNKILINADWSTQWPFTSAAPSISTIFLFCFYYRPPTKLREGNVFT